MGKFICLKCWENEGEVLISVDDISFIEDGNVYREVNFKSSGEVVLQVSTSMEDIKKLLK